MRTTEAALAFALAAGSASPAAAASAGSQSFDFLHIDANARAVGLGGAYTALASDANALLYNPAGLGRVTSSEITLMHNEYVQGIHQEYAAFASRSGWGASVNYLDLSGVERTTLSSPDGALGSFGLTDLAASGGYGRSFFDDGVSLGLGGKYLRESVDGVTAAGWAVDVGALVRVPRLDGLTLGAALLDAGPTVRFQHTREKLPTTARAGAAYSGMLGTTRDTLALDVSKERDDKPRVGAGVETVLARVFALRAGFTTRNDAGLGLTAGAGADWGRLAVDYAFVPFGDLGVAHRMSLTFRWGSRDADPAWRKRMASLYGK